MSGSVNRVILCGNVGKDPEIRSFQNGGRVASFSVATSKSWKSKDGERKEKTEWHRISVTNDALINIIERYVVKGTKIYLEGALQTRKWTDKEGKDQYATEVCLEPYDGKLTLMGGRNDKGSSEEDDNVDENNGGQSHQSSSRSSSNSGGRFGRRKPAGQQDPIPEIDDQIPF